VVVVILLGLLAWALVARLRRPEPLSPFLLAMAAALIAFWAATAFAPGPERVPWASRYLYVDAVLFLLLLCELGRGLDVPRRHTRVGWAVVAVSFAIAIAGNIRELHHATGQLVEESDYIRAGLTSLQMAGDDAVPAFRLDTVLATVTPERTSLTGDKLADNGIPLAHLTAHGYFRVIDEYSSPAYPPTELPSQPAGVRRAADVVLVRAMGLRLEPAPRSSPPACVQLKPSSGTTNGTVALETQDATIYAGPSEPVPVSLGRFADGTPVRVGTVPASGSADLRIPADAPGEESSVRWRIGISDAAGASVCGPRPADSGASR
jgi:hypothetical protein